MVSTVDIYLETNYNYFIESIRFKYLDEGGTKYWGEGEGAEEQKRGRRGER